ncbi:MAG TPA: DNA gyrase inhibitor YacG [Methylomirabilota bacterium]|nr:DNA gyrase inhibitor YacG [Methylomirabilota bacterium]
MIRDPAPSAAGAGRAAPSGRSVRCPRCRRRMPWQGNPDRPFCSLTCRLLDLGVWLDEGYRIGAEPMSSGGEPDVR